MRWNLGSFLIGCSWQYQTVQRKVREQPRAMVLIREFLVIESSCGCLGVLDLQGKNHLATEEASLGSPRGRGRFSVSTKNPGTLAVYLSPPVTWITCTPGPRSRYA